MAANLEGIRFDQIYGDNSGTHDGQQPFDTDGDGTATQEDEFVSITNTTGTPMDVSGWQIWSDSAGTGAPDAPQDGLYHTFPPGTVLQPGETLYIINEISGDAPNWAQEASEGGVESGAGGESTNFLTEGSDGTAGESVALVNPQTGDFIVFNMSSEPPNVQNLSGFPGTTNVGTEDGNAQMTDQWAGTSYRYNANSDSYQPQSASVPCFAAGTLIATPTGEVPVEHLAVGDLVLTKDSGAQPVRWISFRLLTRDDLERTRQYPVEFKPGSLGSGRPRRSLRVSPQHRMLLCGNVFAPARGLTELSKVRVMKGCRRVHYHHILLGKHEVIYAEGVEAESLLPGPTFLAGCSISDRLAIMRIAGPNYGPARPCLRVGEAREKVPQLTNRVVA
ncbi:MAG: Hint domain-containing protein [Pseudomonadota bacterium]